MFYITAAIQISKDIECYSSLWSRLKIESNIGKLPNKVYKNNNKADLTLFDYASG